MTRLSLPHTHRQFERQVSALADQRKEILADIESIQVDSMGAGMTHVRACILMQSVNVVRNINYFLMCVKTESQRAAKLGFHLDGRKMFVPVLWRCSCFLLPAPIFGLHAQCSVLTGQVHKRGGAGRAGGVSRAHRAMWAGVGCQHSAIVSRKRDQRRQGRQRKRSEDDPKTFLNKKKQQTETKPQGP